MIYRTGTRLAELQREFMRGLVEGESAELLAAIEGGDAARRFAIYRNNWRSNLRQALRTGFPVVEQLVGAEFFTWLADNFIDAHPSRSGNLDDYGVGFATFVRAFPALAELPYIGDVAELEWLIDAVMAAPDKDAGDPDVLPPHTRLLHSSYPVHRIWQVNQPEWRGDDTVSLDEGEVRLLIMRRSDDAAPPRYELLLQPLGEADFAALR